MTPRRADGSGGEAPRRSVFIQGFAPTPPRRGDQNVIGLHRHTRHAIDPITQAVAEGAGLPRHAVLLPVESEPDLYRVRFSIQLQTGRQLPVEIFSEPTRLLIEGQSYLPGGHPVPDDARRALAEAVNGRSSFGRLLESQYDAIIAALLEFALPCTADPRQELASLGRLHAMLDPHALHLGLESALPLPVLERLQALNRWGFYPRSVDLRRADPARAFAQLRTPKLASIRAAGLTEDGQYFLANTEEAGMPSRGGFEARISDGAVHWQEWIPSVEQRLLNDPSTVAELRTVVLEALARFGPLTDRQLVRATGLSQTCLVPLLVGPSSLFVAYPGVVLRREDGSVALARAADRWRRREALLVEVRTHLHRAFQDAYWGELGLRCAERIAKALHAAIGSHQAAWKLSQPDAALDRDLVDQAVAMIREVVGPLSRVTPDAVMRARAQLYGTMQASAVPLDPLAQAQGHAPEGILQSVLDFSGESSQQDRWAAIAEALESLHGLSDQQLSTADRRVEAKLPALPDSSEIKSARRAQEDRLRSSEDWARYLEKEYPLPSLLRERLKAQAPDNLGEILRALELDLSLPVATEVKRYLERVVARDEKGREALASRLVQLATEAARESTVPSKHRDIEFVAGLLSIPPTGLLDS